jgi:hypothetical protein
MENKLTLPTETIELPSKGLLYPPSHPLASGKIEMKYMSAYHEDILTNQNYIKQGTVIDKLLQALIVTPVNYNEILICDKNALMIAARILGYGKDYSFSINNPVTKENDTVTIDLSTLKEKYLNESLITKGVNSFTYVLPQTKNEITFKLLNIADEIAIENELKALKKLYPNESFDITTRLKHTITSVNGLLDKKDIKEFVDKMLMIQDSRSLRKYIKEVSPEILLEFNYDKDGYTEEGVNIPVGLNFFWPDFGV